MFLTTPVSMSGATSPAPRAMARIMPVRMPGLAWGRTTRRIVCHFDAPHATAASRSARGTAASASSVDDDHDRHRQERERERGPEDAAAAERRGGQVVGVERLVDPAADEVAEEPEPEDAEHDARDAGEVVHRDPHRRDDEPLLRVLAQVERRDHAEGHDEDRHQERHQHRAEDRGPDAAVRVGLARARPTRSARSGPRRGRGVRRSRGDSPRPRAGSRRWASGPGTGRRCPRRAAPRGGGPRP